MDFTCSLSALKGFSLSVVSTWFGMSVPCGFFVLTHTFLLPAIFRLCASIERHDSSLVFLLFVVSRFVCEECAAFPARRD